MLPEDSHKAILYPIYESVSMWLCWRRSISGQSINLTCCKPFTDGLPRRHSRSKLLQSSSLSALLREYHVQVSREMLLGLNLHMLMLSSHKAEGTLWYIVSLPCVCKLYFPFTFSIFWNRMKPDVWLSMLQGWTPSRMYNVHHLCIMDHNRTVQAFCATNQNDDIDHMPVAGLGAAWGK